MKMINRIKISKRSQNSMMIFSKNSELKDKN